MAVRRNRPQCLENVLYVPPSSGELPWTPSRLETHAESPGELDIKKSLNVERLRCADER